jgi:5-amino-6-(5-phosphoribosylamino)uracil reductase
MRQLLPAATDVDPAAAYAADLRPAPADRPWVLINMITSVDGATAVEGVSGGLGGPADKEVFRAIRGVADVIVVAAGTLRAEHYRPVQVRARSATPDSPGTAPDRLAVVTARFDLDPTAAVFAESDPSPSCSPPPTPSIGGRRRDRTSRGADHTGDQVDLPAAPERCGPTGPGRWWKADRR